MMCARCGNPFDSPVHREQHRPGFHTFQRPVGVPLTRRGSIFWLVGFGVVAALATAWALWGR